MSKELMVTVLVVTAIVSSLLGSLVSTLNKQGKRHVTSALLVGLFGSMAAVYLLMHLGVLVVGSKEITAQVMTMMQVILAAFVGALGAPMMLKVALKFLERKVKKTFGIELDVKYEEKPEKALSEAQKLVEKAWDLMQEGKYKAANQVLYASCKMAPTSEAYRMRGICATALDESCHKTRYFYETAMNLAVTDEQFGLAAMELVEHSVQLYFEGLNCDDTMTREELLVLHTQLKLRCKKRVAQLSDSTRSWLQTV